MSIKKKLEKILQLDFHLKDVLKWASISFGIKILAAIAGFLFNIVLAHQLDADGVGVYYLVFSIISFGMIFGRFGTNRSMLRFVAPLAATEQWGKIKGVMQIGLSWTTGLSLLSASILYFGADFISLHLFQRNDLSEYIRIFAFAVPFLSWMYFFAGAFTGLKRIDIALSSQGIALPLFAMIGIWFLVDSYQVKGAIYSYVGALVLICLFLFLAWFYIISRKAKGQQIEKFTTQEFMKSSIPLFWASLFQQIIIISSTLMLGFWVADEYIGQFAIAKRITMLTSMFLVAFNSIVSPKIGAFYAKNEWENIEKMVGGATVIVTLLVLPIFLLLLFFPGFFLSFFGKNFVGGSNLLVIMLIGQFVSIVMGPVGVILMMCEREKLLRNSFFIAAVSILLLNFLLIPIFGVVGAAIASTTTMIIQNLMAYYYVRKEFNINTFAIKNILKMIRR